MDEKMKAYQELLLARGLTITNFDGHTLLLKYEAADDVVFKGGSAVGGGDLTLHAISALDQVPGANLFPGIRRVTIDL